MSNAINNFMAASKTVLTELVREIQSSDPAAYRSIAAALASGGAYLEARASLSTLGASEAHFLLVTGDGTRHHLAHAEFD